MKSWLALAGKGPHAKRLRVIVGVLAQYGLADRLKHIPLEIIRQQLATPAARKAADEPFGARLRLAFLELGTTFIKLGQVLSTREDLLGEANAKELAELQSDTPADTPAQVKERLEAAFGNTVDDLFESIDYQAFSSASIGQVHRATLKNGPEVVVKVLHHGIEDTVRIDLEILEELAALVEEHIDGLRQYRPKATVREFCRTMRKELDLSWEKRHIEQFSENFKKDKTVTFPEIYPQACANTVLTMGFMPGIPGSKTEKMKAAGIDLDQTAKLSANVFLNMIFRDGFYHADPHPGNILIQEDGSLGLLDCGMVGRVDEELKAGLGDMMILLAQKDTQAIADQLLALGDAGPDINRSEFRREIADFVADHGFQDISGFDLGAAIKQMNQILAEYSLRLPSSAALLLKTLVMLQGTATAFSPNFSIMDLLAPFRKTLVRERANPLHWWKRLLRTGRELDRLVTHGPRNLFEVLDHLRHGTLRLQHHVPKLEETVNRLVLGMMISSVFLGSCLLLTIGNHWLMITGGIIGYAISAIGAILIMRGIRRDSRKK